MKKLLLLLVGAIVAFASSASVTIRFQNTGNWNQVNAWAWGNNQDGPDWLRDNGFPNSSWPGPAMTAAGDNWYEITFTNAPQSLIFSSGGNNQTATINYVEGATYTPAGAVAPPAPPTSYTIYFYDSGQAEHPTVNAYVWNGSNNNGTYPGVAMTRLKGMYVKKNDIYYPVWSYTATLTWEPKNVIINNGKDDGNKLTGGDALFVDNGFYTNGSTTPETGLELVGTQDPEEKEYTIYFFNSGEENITEVGAYVWQQKDVEVKPWAERDAMERIENKYVYYDGKYCPVWSYTFKTDITPRHVIFTTPHQSPDLPFENGNFYNYNYQSVDFLDIIDKPHDDVVTIYMHWKEMFLKNANGTPKCHLCNTDNNNQTAWNSEEENMYLVNKKYQIWGYDIPVSDVAKYNNVVFHIYKDGNKVDEYAANKAQTYDKENWTKYIYTVHDGQYAPQSYMTYEEFLEEASKGYPNLYVVGGGDGDQNGMEITIDGVSQPLSWLPDEGTKVDPDTPQDATFYVELKPKFQPVGSSTAWNARFKMTWIDVKGYQERNGNSKTHSDRDWATFDLGCIGVDDELVAKNWGDILSVEDGTRYSIFDINKSFPILEYNQYDWVISNGKATSGNTYYAVVDLHPECRTVTLVDFDPNPSVNASVSAIQQETVGFDVAEALHNNHLYASELNGHIYMTELNKASGSATINKAPGSVVGQAGFGVEYTLNLNGNTVIAKNPGTITFDYMPVAADSRQVSIRAKYTDDQTKLTFHSRTGKGSITLPQSSLAAPKNLELTGRYVFQESTDDNRQIYGVYVEGLDSEFASELNAYSDFSLDEGNPYFVHKDLDWYSKAQGIDWVHTWTGWQEDENGQINWSKALMSKRPTEDPAPLFIKDVVTVSSFDELDDKTITGKVYAVYPFLYNPNATLEVNASGAPRRAAAAATDYDGFIVTNTHIPNDIKITVTTEGAISGIDAVEAENVVEGPVEYYTVSGIRVVGQPAPGLYIRRQGDKVSKVVVK